MKYRAVVYVPSLDTYTLEENAAPLLGWAGDVAKRGGTLHVNSGFRSVAEQQPFRDKYVAWLNAGKPVQYDPAKMSSVPANKPGRSGHQGGISVDLRTIGVFPGEPADQQVDLLWATGKPWGFTPIIDQPDEARAERWHFDRKNGWSTLFAHLGSDIGYLCTALDTGNAGEWQKDEAVIQALLLRAGFDIGEPDGVAGKRTYAAIALSGFAEHSPPGPYQWEAIADYLRTLPAATVWQKVTG